MRTQTAELREFPTAGLLKWIIATVASLWLAVPVTVQVLLILMGLDILSGFILAAIQKGLDSHAGFVGVLKKVLVLILIGAAHVVMKPMNFGFDVAAVVATAYCLNEAISIVENCARAGLPIPAPLVDALLQAKYITGRQKREVVNLRDKET